MLRYKMGENTIRCLFEKRSVQNNVSEQHKLEHVFARIKMVSEPRTSKIDLDIFTSLLSSAALVEDDYRPRVKYVVQRLEQRSPAFELFRQVIEGLEPHFASSASFNAAFAGTDDAHPAAVRQVFPYGHVQRTEANYWKVVRETIVAACPDPSLSAEEKLAKISKNKAENWTDFVDRYFAACTISTASRETQVKTLYKKLPPHLKRLVMHLPPTTMPADIRGLIRNVSFWESGTQAKIEVDEDAMDIDLGVVQANVATDGRVIGRDGAINFSAITNAGRVMVGAREICKTSRREAQNMLRFLQRICNGQEQPAGQRRPMNQQRRWGGRRAYMAADDDMPEGSGEPICETLSEGGEEDAEREMTRTYAAQTESRKKEQKRVMKLGLVSQSHLGYPRRIDALVDTGAESSIMSLALARELGAKILPNKTKLLLAHGKTAQVTGECHVEVSIEKATHPTFTLDCLVLPNPGYDLLLGIDAMTKNQISAHPHNRSVSINGRQIKCLFAGPKMEREAKNEVAKQEDVGRLTERVDHLPTVKGDRIQVPLNRSIVLGPNESRMVKTPIVIPRGMVHQRTPVVAPHFSVHLGVQYETFSTLTLTNHRKEPVRITGKTTIFEIPTRAGDTLTIRDCNGQQRQLRGNKQSFPKRQ